MAHFSGALATLAHVFRSVLVAVTVAASLAVSAASAAADVSIRRTAHGIPHVTASTFRDLGQGYGYAFAQDNICDIAEAYVTVAGDRSRFFGADEAWRQEPNATLNNNLDSDAFYRAINESGVIEQLISAQPPNGPSAEVRDLIGGYVEGYNRRLRELGGAAGVDDPRCTGQPWVREITEIDAYRRLYQLGQIASSGVSIAGIGGPKTPGATVGTIAPTGDQLAAVNDALTLPIGSNAIALGRDATDNGRGLLLGNPHFPWDGSERFYQAHLTVPGKMDVQGASLFGVPLILIGNTRGLAWTHTVSTARRFTMFELQLVPGQPTTYLVDGKPHDMQQRTVTIPVKTADGGVEQRQRTIYSTMYGPVTTDIGGQPLFPWTGTTAFALGDVNATGFRYMNHFLATDQAQSVDEYDAIQRRFQGIPWVNSLAADASGQAYYADIGSMPGVTDAKAQACNTALGQALFAAARLAVLDGSRSSCQWDTGPGAVQPGTLGPDQQPSLRRTDYVENSNDSYWLPNPQAPLEGFSRIIGDERSERRMRTRLGFRMIQERLEDGGRLSRRELQDLVFNNRHMAGELWRDELVELCRSPRSGVPAAACDALANWDLHVNLDSRGVALFDAFVFRALRSRSSPYRVPFDPADPVNTPRGLNTENPEVLQALRAAVAEQEAAGRPFDARWGDVQTDRRGTERIPIHGGGLNDALTETGVFNIMGDVFPEGDEGPDVDYGSSYVQAVQFTSRGCPVEPRTILTYSQSANPKSPFFADQTRMFSRKEWVDVPFCEDEVAKATLSTTRLSPGSRPVVCRSRRVITVHVPKALRARTRSVTLFVAGKRVRTVRGGRRGLRVDLRGTQGRRRVAVRLRVRLRSGRVLTIRRAFRTCTWRRKRG